MGRALPGVAAGRRGRRIRGGLRLVENPCTSESTRPPRVARPRMVANFPLPFHDRDSLDSWCRIIGYREPVRVRGASVRRILVISALVVGFSSTPAAGHHRLHWSGSLPPETFPRAPTRRRCSRASAMPTRICTWPLGTSRTARPVRSRPGATSSGRVGAGFRSSCSPETTSPTGSTGNINAFSACLPNQLPGLVGTYGRQSMSTPAGTPSCVS